MAAQGNKAVSIYYFAYEKGLDINQRDSKQRTPMHWAVFNKSEVAQAYILSVQGVDLEAKDDNGFTPLHLAVQSVEGLKSTRPVRALLLKGAKRDSKDAKDRTPRELIGKDLPAQLRNDLNGILVSY